MKTKQETDEKDNLLKITQLQTENANLRALTSKFEKKVSKLRGDLETLKASHKEEVKDIEERVRKEVHAEIKKKEQEQIKYSSGIISKQASDRTVTQPYVTHTVINLY